MWVRGSAFNSLAVDQQSRADGQAARVLGLLENFHFYQTRLAGYLAFHRHFQQTTVVITGDPQPRSLIKPTFTQ